MQKTTVNKVISIVLKVLALTLAVVFMWRILSLDAFDKDYASMISLVPTQGGRIIAALLRVSANAAVIIGIFIAFFDYPALKRLARFFIPIALIFNLAYSSTILTLYLGIGVADGPSTYFRTAEFIIENSLLLLITLGVWILYIRNKEYKGTHFNKTLWKNIGLAVLFLLFVAILSAPNSTYLALFGPLYEEAVDFKITHRIFIYLTFLIPLCLMFIFRFHNPRYKYMVCLMISVTCFYGFFSLYNFQTYIDVFNAVAQHKMDNVLNSFPLHLCNAGVIISLIAFVFKNKPCFYFNYLINVLGATFAILMPNNCGDVFYQESIQFWQNHLWIVALPLLAVSLDVFPRPKRKYVWYAVGAFTVYFIVVATIDTWFGFDEATGQGADYFFLNTDKFISHFKELKWIRSDFIIKFVEPNGFVHKIYWLYWLIIYVVYVLLTFAVYYLFKLLDLIRDSHYDLMCEIKKKKETLKALQNDNSLKGDPNMIEIKNLVKCYGKESRRAVDDVTLTIYPGDVFGFLGHNGAGKSTLIKCIIGAQPITSGTISIFGHNITVDPLGTKRLIGYVPDNHAVYEGLTGREYINYIANLYLVTTKDRQERIKKYGDMFHISSALDKQISSYSHGMKQKLTIIAALIHEPKVWILDEPLTGLDPTSCYQIKECMKEHAAKGNIVFFSSHVIEVVENVCNKIAVIGHGKLLCEYDLKQLKKEGKSLEDVYLKYVTNVDSL